MPSDATPCGINSIIMGLSKDGMPWTEPCHQFVTQKTSSMAFWTSLSGTVTDPDAEYAAVNERISGIRDWYNSASDWEKKDLAVRSLSSILLAGAIGKVAGELRAAETAASRQAAARTAYKTALWPDEKIASHAAGIDFSQPVEVIKIAKGTQMVQYQTPGNPTGNYFAPVGTPPDSLGINPAGRVAKLFVATRDVTALKSTAASTASNFDIPEAFRGGGGGIQYFVPDSSAFGPLP